MDEAAFERLVARHRGELYAHWYRMLGSVQDAEDALQESLLGAWRGMAGFEGRSSLRAWLYRVTTHACLRLIARRPRRMLSPDQGPPRRATDDLGEPVAGPVWLEPLSDELAANEAGDGDPAATYLRREGVELAFVAALQHLPGTQRAVLILRQVLGFSAAEVARILDTTPASVNSALQRARKAVDQRIPATTQRAELNSGSVATLNPCRTRDGR
jgi:RNA polymerase sigma-70 factor (TIGR02960 family)